MKVITRTEMLMDEIRSRIAGRELGPGDRLPSVRRFAAAMRVSPSTVVEAYDRLAAEGIIRARPGSGFFVTGSLMSPVSIADIGPPVDHEIDPFWVSRQSLDADPRVEKPGCGWLPPEWMPEAAVRRAVRSLARSHVGLLCDYGGTRGSLTLRRLLLGRLADEGIRLSAEQIMLTGSGTQAIDTICRFLLHTGDTVLIDDPCYFNFQAVLRAHGVRIVSVPYTPSGPNTGVFESVVVTERPRLYITNSALQNPTGASISPQVAYRVLNIATAHGMIIVEDDIMADFEPSRSPRLAVMDGLDHVIRIGSFSKTLSASARCGYIAARADWIEGLVDLQVATNFGGPSPLATEIISSVLAGGSYRKHIVELRGRLSRARDEVAMWLSPLGIVPWIEPRGGYYLWCRLPDGYESTEIAKRCREYGVILAPGNVFSVSESAGSFLRFNVAQTGKKTISVLQMAMN